MATFEEMVKERLDDAHVVMDTVDGGSEDYRRTYDVFKDLSHTEIELKKLELERDIKTRELDIRKEELEESKKKSKRSMIGKIVGGVASSIGAILLIYTNVNQGNLAGQSAYDKFTKKLERD